MQGRVGVRYSVAFRILKFGLSLAIFFAGWNSLSVTLAQDVRPAPTPQTKQDDQVIDPDDVISVNTTEVLLLATRSLYLPMESIAGGEQPLALRCALRSSRRRQCT